MEKFIELIKDFMADSDIELKKEEIEKLKELSPEKAKELTEAIETLNDYKEGWPNDLVNAVTALTKNSAYDYPENEPGEKKFEIKEFVEKAGQRLSKATLEQLKKIIAIAQGLVGDREDKVKKGHKDLPADVIAELEEAQLLKQKLDEIEEAKKAEEEKKAEERIKKLEAEIEALKKGDRTSIEGQDTDDDDDKDDKDVKKKKEKWPTLNRAFFPQYYSKRRH